MINIDYDNHTNSKGNNFIKPNLYIEMQYYQWVLVVIIIINNGVQ